jgi:hypothetical protein
LLCVFLSGCEGDSDNYLSGSMTKSFDMDFDSTRVRLYESELAIEYVDDSDQGEKIAFRVTINSGEVVLESGTAYDLVTDGTVSRGQGYGSPLPAVESGTLYLDAYSAEDGSPVSGSFNAKFVASDQTVKTLRGGFSASLEVVAW